MNTISIEPKLDPESMTPEQRVARIIEVRNSVLANEPVSDEDIREAVALIRLSRATPAKAAKAAKPATPNFSLDMFD